MQVNSLNFGCQNSHGCLSYKRCDNAYKEVKQVLVNLTPEERKDVLMRLNELNLPSPVSHPPRIDSGLKSTASLAAYRDNPLYPKNTSGNKMVLDVDYDKLEDTYNDRIQKALNPTVVEVPETSSEDWEDFGLDSGVSDLHSDYKDMNFYESYDRGHDSRPNTAC